MRIESVAGIIFTADRKNVLLIQRRDVPVWVLPGGAIDSGERPQAAIIREILEETGFTVKVDRLVGRYFPINRLSRPTELFECCIETGEMRVTPETRGICFFPLHALPKRLPPPYGEWIEEAKLPNPPVEKKLTSVNYRALLFYSITHPILVIRFLLARLGWAVNSSLREKEEGKHEGE